MTSRRQQTRLPMTAAVMTLVGTTRGQLSSSLPSPQSSWASHTHDSNTQRLFYSAGGDTEGWLVPARAGPGPEWAGQGPTLQWKLPGWQKKQFFSSEPLGQRFW